MYTGTGTPHKARQPGSLIIRRRSCPHTKTKDDLFVFTFKPMNTYEEVLDEFVVSDVKAKFKLTQRNQVPPTALNEKKTSGLDTTEKPWQLS